MRKSTPPVAPANDSSGEDISSLPPIPPAAYGQASDGGHTLELPPITADNPAIAGPSAAPVPKVESPTSTHGGPVDSGKIPPPPIPKADIQAGKDKPLAPVEPVPAVPVYSAPAATKKTSETEVFTSGQCPSKLPSPSQKGEVYCNIFQEGCLYVPKKVAKRPLFYFRDQPFQAAGPAPASTQALFSDQGRYRLDAVAEANEQIVLATHSPQTVISAKTLECLQKFSSDKKIDVAAHREGYSGLVSSASTLKDSVANLRLLDSAINGDPLIASLLKIAPRSCYGFYTSYALSPELSSKAMADYVARQSGCNFEEASGHIVSVSPFLRKTPWTAQRTPTGLHNGAI